MMAARLQFYPSHRMTATRPAVHTSPVGDVYLTLLAVSGDRRSATVRLAWNPLVGWIWAGGALTVLGGVIAAWPRRRRTSTSVSAAAQQPAVAVAAGR
jgi:cytochrome c-type biogenesis protein CcmF